MKAVICNKSGSSDVLNLVEVQKPFPLPGEILVKVYASSVTRGDIHLRKMSRLILVPLGWIFGFKPMKITGVEFAGIVEETGSEVLKFKKGDRVFGTATGLSFGGNAEYLCVPEKHKKGVISHIPENVGFETAAVTPVGGMTAHYILAKAGNLKGKKVLVYGASGSVGSFAVQLAKEYGAMVTGVCSKANMQMVRKLGAAEVLDYTSGNFCKEPGPEYDVVFDAVGKISRSRCAGMLKSNGRFLSVKYPTSEKKQTLEYLASLLSEEKLKPLIDREYSLGQIKEAHDYVEKGHKRGNVLIKIGS